MKKNIWIISLTSFCFSVLLLSQTYIYYESNVPASSQTHLTNYVLDRFEADIDGDTIDDEITVFGKKLTETDEMANEINISVRFSKTGFTKKTNTTMLSGNNHDLKIYDFTGDNKKDIMLCVPDENDGINTTTTCIFDFSHSIPKNIFTELDNRGAKISMKYGSNFVINATLDGNQKFSINLNKQSNNLIASGIYNSDGSVSTDTLPQITKYTTLTPYKKDGNGVYELCGKQKITNGNSFVLCEVISYLKYTDNRWQIYKIEYSYPQNEDFENVNKPKEQLPENTDE